jgi:hypothetical protein
MPQKLGPWILVAAFGGFFLALFLVFKVLDTKFFRGDPELGGSASPIENEKTALAHAYCAAAAAKSLGEGGSRSLPGYTAWDIGFNRYLVKASLESPDRPGRGKTYLCKILDQGGSAPGDWVVQSLEYLD